MSRPAFLLAVFALLTAPARAQIKEDACLPLAGVGCWYAPEGAPANSPLLVYLRGHHPRYKGDVPAAQALASSRQAFTGYDLGRIAAGKNMALLVTYRSDAAATPKVLAALAEASTRTFSSVVLASHSGGYVGLAKTLAAGVAPTRVVMLDNFYGAGGGGLAASLQRLISSGMACSGFRSPHNDDNYEKGYEKAVACAIDRRGANEHNTGVGLCLAGYLDGRPCP